MNLSERRIPVEKFAADLADADKAEKLIGILLLGAATAIRRAPELFPIAEEVVLDSEVLQFCQESGYRQLDDALSRGIQIEDVMDLFPGDRDAVERNCHEMEASVLSSLLAMMEK